MNQLNKIFEIVHEWVSWGIWLLWIGVWPLTLLCLASKTYGGGLFGIIGFVPLLFVPRVIISEMSRWDYGRFLRRQEIFWSVLVISMVELGICWAILQGAAFIPWERDFSDVFLRDNSWEVGIAWLVGFVVELAVTLWERKINSVSLEQPEPVLRA